MEQQDTTIYKYAVVQFDNSEFSVVPLIWLTEPNHCYWPQGMKNKRTAIIREMPVKENWEKYKCHIISKHDTYEVALKAEKEAVASSESEVEIRVGKRKVKSNKYKEYDVSYSGLPRLTLFSKSSDNSNLSEESNQTVSDTLCDNIQHNDENIALSDYDISVPSDNVGHNEGLSEKNNQTAIYVTDNTEHFDENVTLSADKNNMPIIIEGENNNKLFNLITDLKIMVTRIQIEIEDLNKKQEKSLLQIQETTNMILAKINSEQYNKENFILNDNKIKQYLPLTSIQNFLQFENILKNDNEAFMQVLNKVLLIGGKNEKDFIKRILTAIFTDDLAHHCSWTGQEDNFKIGDTQPILPVNTQVVGEQVMQYIGICD